MELTFPLPSLGIICVLSIICSQEYVLGEVYKDLGLSEEEIMDHFTGLAFLVSNRWNRLGYYNHYSTNSFYVMTHSFHN